MDKIHAMQIFVRVADLASFTGAADSLGLPKATVSRQLQALETHLGTPLLHRTTRRVQLTQDGRIYYERCCDVLTTLAEMDTLFQREPATLSGKLHVMVSAMLAAPFLLPRLPRFLQHYPGIELELSSSERPSDAIGDGVDCVVRTGGLQEAGLVARPLGYLAMVNCASPDYLQRFGTPRSPEDLAQHATIHYRQPSGEIATGFEFYATRQRQHFPVGGTLTVNSMEAYCAACQAGLGIIQAPRLTMAAALQAGTLSEILPAFPAQPLPLTLLWPHRRNLAQRVRVFMTWLSQEITDYVA